MDGRLTDRATAGDLTLLKPQTEPQTQDLFDFFAWTHAPGARSLLHGCGIDFAPLVSSAPASIKAFSGNHSGHVNNDSGLLRFSFHISPESLFRISRNHYSPFPGTLIHMPRNPQLEFHARPSSMRSTFEGLTPSSSSVETRSAFASAITIEAGGMPSSFS